MKLTFEQHRFSAKVRRRLEVCDSILSEYAGQGYVMTVRSLFYQLGSHHSYPNTRNAYAVLINTLTNGRMAGRIDWNHLTDHMRVVKQLPH